MLQMLIKICLSRIEVPRGPNLLLIFPPLLKKQDYWTLFMAGIQIKPRKIDKELNQDKQL
jgi:hypothetical protein